MIHASLSLHFIDVQCLDMFRAILAHPQEAIHGQNWWLLCAIVDVGWYQDMEDNFHTLRPTHTYNCTQYSPFCVRVLPPEDGQVMPETCRHIEHQ
jgi:hypothetical protein